MQLILQNMLTKYIHGCIIKIVRYRGVEQLAARWAHNPKVGGSSPPPATNYEAFCLFFLF